MYFWDLMDGQYKIQSIFIAGGFNEHKKKIGDENYRECMGHMNLSKRIDIGETIVDFAMAFDLAIASTLRRIKNTL